jgi:HPt (histidine-containing phosphotransfer) domain-containing protein
MCISTDNSIVDVSRALAQLQGDRELFLELADIFLQAAPEIMARIVGGLNSCNVAELTGAAHQLSGSLPVIGGHALVETTRRLEQMQGFESMTAIAEEVRSLQHGLAKLGSELRTLVNRSFPLVSAQPSVHAVFGGVI